MVTRTIAFLFFLGEFPYYLPPGPLAVACQIRKSAILAAKHLVAAGAPAGDRLALEAATPPRPEQRNLTLVALAVAITSAAAPLVDLWSRLILAADWQ